MKDREAIKQFIINELEKHGAIQLNNIESFNYLKAGHIDSISIMKFIIALENEFDIEFTDEEMASNDFSIVSGLVEMIFTKSY